MLGAIERLVYRVELMEKRMQRTEELLYHVMEGSHNNNKREGNKSYFFLCQEIYCVVIREVSLRQRS